MKRLSPVLGCCLALMLGGCSSSEDDLRAWMSESSRDLRPNLRPLPKLKLAEVISYEGEGKTDPFRATKLEPDKKTSALAPDPNWRREPLESYALENIRMVGVLIKNGQTHAIVSVDKALYQVRVGNHLGMNYGRITAISEADITLKELVEDSSGEWAERVSTLQLQEQAAQEVKK
jgi:type IV pilus assembly protein PilP